MEPRLVRFVAAVGAFTVFCWWVSDAAAADVCSIVKQPENFDHQNVTLQGTAASVRETTSHRGNDYTTFKLEDPTGCGAVNIFIWGHPTLASGDHVRVDGVFETVHQQGQYKFYNELGATKVTPLTQ
jgi:hypothetical protein